MSATSAQPKEIQSSPPSDVGNSGWSCEKNMSVCILTSVHPAFDVRIFHKEALSLSMAGYDVTLIAPHAQACQVEGVRIEPVKIPRGRLERMTKTVWQIYRAAARRRASVYHFHDPELIPLGFLLKLRGNRVIYDVHENVPQDIRNKDWIWRPLRWVFASVAGLAETISGASFDGIIVATPAIARRFPANKTQVVRNFPQLDYKNGFAALPYEQRKANCVYVGSISDQRGVREMIEAISLLPGQLQARLVLAGRYGSPALEKELRDKPGWTGVDSLGWLSRPQIAELMGRAKIGLVTLHPTSCFIEALPIKLFEYMEAGIPVIASDFPLWRKIVGDIGCGLLVDPCNPADIAEAIEWILTHPLQAKEMGVRGAAAIRSNYNWKLEADKLLALYGRLTSGQVASVASNQDGSE